MIYFLLFFLFFLLFTLLLLWWQKKEKEHFQINNTTYKLNSETFYHILSHWNPNDNSTFYSEDPRSG